MEKLKTLKDLGIIVSGIRMLSPEELKAEAIKWVKDLRSKIKKTKDEATNNIYRNLISWIKHFFNITEEDLK